MFSDMWNFRCKLADFLVELIRRYIVPKGSSRKYALKKEAMNRVYLTKLFESKLEKALKGD